MSTQPRLDTLKCAALQPDRRVMAKAPLHLVPCWLLLVLCSSCCTCLPLSCTSSKSGCGAHCPNSSAWDPTDALPLFVCIMSSAVILSTQNGAEGVHFAHVLMMHYVPILAHHVPAHTHTTMTAHAVNTGRRQHTRRPVYLLYLPRSKLSVYTACLLVCTAVAGSASGYGSTTIAYHNQPTHGKYAHAKLKARTTHSVHRCCVCDSSLSVISCGRVLCSPNCFISRNSSAHDL
jgi:hypothetical protein